MKSIQRKQRLFRSTDGGVSTIYADSGGGMRKLKCPSGCGGVAVPFVQSETKNRFICQGCGMEFNSTQM